MDENSINLLLITKRQTSSFSLYYKRNLSACRVHGNEPKPLISDPSFICLQSITKDQKLIQRIKFLFSKHVECYLQNILHYKIVHISSYIFLFMLCSSCIMTVQHLFLHLKLLHLAPFWLITFTFYNAIFLNDEIQSQFIFLNTQLHLKNTFVSRSKIGHK